MGSIAIGVLGVLGVLGLGGCSVVGSVIAPKDTSTEQNMTPDEAKVDLKSQLDAIQLELGGTWDARDSPIAEGCKKEPDSGFYYRSFRFRGEPIADYDSAAKQAVVYWKSRGYSIGRAQYRPTQRLVSATSPNGTQIYLTLDDKESSIQAEGPCNVGNWPKVSDDDVKKVKERERNTPTPSATPAG